MPWYSKEQPTPFDNSPLEGLSFLNGDILSQLYHQEWIAGKKYPLISFPSGLSREVWESAQQRDEASVQILGVLDLPYKSTSDEAHERLLALPEEQGLVVSRYRANTLRILSRYSGRGYYISYDDQAERMTDIRAFPEEAMQLLDGETRALLPELYANEKLGMKAVAPLKFFTPDSNWTWYPTEFDGDDLFFGLVSGYAVELGYFSLTELEGVRGMFGLPIERDLYFEPQTLEEIKQLHERWD